MVEVTARQHPEIALGVFLTATIVTGALVWTYAPHWLVFVGLGATILAAAWFISVSPGPL